MIVCIGEAVIDMFHKDGVFYPLPGGCAYNTSIAIGRLGAPAAFLGRLSKNFFGDIQVKRLSENNVNTGLLLRRDENPILAFIKTEEGMQPQYAFYEEGTVDRLLSEEELRSSLQKNNTPEISCVVFGSISMAMEPIATTIENFLEPKTGDSSAFSVYSAANAPPVIAFDPNIRPFMIKDRDAYMKRFIKWAGFCTIAKVSSEDFEFIFPDASPKDALKKMSALGTQLAIVTLGPEGAIALLKRSDGSVIEAGVPGISIEKTADTVGAGDTFLGAFLSRLSLRGKMSRRGIENLSEAELLEALTFANKAAAIVCTRNGAQPPSLAEIENYFPVSTTTSLSKPL